MIRKDKRPDSLEVPTSLPEDFFPTHEGGLTDEEAASRKPNVAKADPGKSVGQILRENLLTLFNLLNVALGVCLALVGSWRNMLFLGVVISNAAIGTIQELRARKTIHRLQLLSSPEAHVLRGGQERTCRPEELVEGDLVILRAGDQVVADAVVREGTGSANEALLTGESDPELKHPGDWLMSGSYIAEGRFVAQLVHVGDESYAARLTRSAREIRRPKSALMTDLNKLIRFVSILLVPIGLLLFAKQHFLMDAPLEEAIPGAVAAMIGMIPEGLMLLTSVAMAAGVIKLGGHHTLVQELYGIETLARADVLCLDKTGTITTGRMTLEALVPMDADEAQLRHALSRFLGAFEMNTGTLQALAREIVPGKEAPIAVLPFSSARKKSAASFADGQTLILGAPDFVMERCASAELRARVDEYARQGKRVLLLAQTTGCVSETEAPVPQKALGLCILGDEIRENAAETLRYFRQQGVTLKVISGDDPQTVSRIARTVGMEGAENWIDVSRLTDDELEEACERCTVFGRVTPERKRTLVEALKACGHSVAMTGDGVNDIPALKAADCSIAMAGGADAAKHAAQLTLLDGDFSSMPLVVGEGRRVIGNITRAASLFLVKTLYSFALAVLMIFIPAAYPFQPIQLTLVSSLTIGIPTFFLALEPNRSRVQGKFLQTVALRAIPGAAAVTVCAILSMLAGLRGMPQDVCSTMATIAAGTVGLMMLFTVCRPFTPLRAAVLACMIAAFVGAVLLFGQMFFLVELTASQALGLVNLTVIAAGVMLALSFLLRRRFQRREENASA